MIFTGSHSVKCHLLFSRDMGRVAENLFSASSDSFFTSSTKPMSLSIFKENILSQSPETGRIHLNKTPAEEFTPVLFHLVCDSFGGSSNSHPFILLPAHTGSQELCVLVPPTLRHWQPEFQPHQDGI